VDQLYKLTDANLQTHKGFQWEIGKAKSTGRKGKNLCSGDVFHAYRGLEQGLLLNPNHGGYEKPRLFAAEGKVVAEDYGKVGCHRLKLTEELPVPKWFTNEKKVRLVRVAFAILCAESVIAIYEKHYPNDDRPRQAIEAARKYLKKPTNAYAANADAAAAAAYAAYAAYAAANAAANAAYAAYAAAYAAANAYAAAAYAAYAADAADAANASIDFAELAREAVRMVVGGQKDG
jgi:hypothetical protein